MKLSTILKRNIFIACILMFFLVPIAQAQEKPSPHEEILFNVEFFRGAIRKGNWKLVKMTTLPGKTELFDLSKDPYEQDNVAAKYPKVVEDLEARLVAYAREKKTSLC